MLARRFYVVSLAGAALLTLTGCGGDSPVASSSVVGRFALESVNGKPLPYTLADTAFQGSAIRVEVVSPSLLNLKSDLSFQFIVTTKVSAAGAAPMVAADTASGTYSIAGRRLSMTAANGSTLQANWDGANSLVLNATPDVLVFRR